MAASAAKRCSSENLRDSALARTTAGGASTTLHDSIQIKENAADIVTKARDQGASRSILSPPSSSPDTAGQSGQSLTPTLPKILAGSYLRDSALARTTAGGASTTLHDSIQIKENAADIVFRCKRRRRLTCDRDTVRGSFPRLTLRHAYPPW
jgi:hypothetical protein